VADGVAETVPPSAWNSSGTLGAVRAALGALRLPVLDALAGHTGLQSVLAYVVSAWSAGAPLGLVGQLRLALAPLAAGAHWRARRVLSQPLYTTKIAPHVLHVQFVCMLQ